MNPEDMRLLYKKNTPVAKELERSKKPSTDLEALRAEVKANQERQKNPARRDRKLRLSIARQAERTLEEALANYDLAQSAIDEQRKYIKTRESEIKNLEDEIETKKKLLKKLASEITTLEHKRSDVVKEAAIAQRPVDAEIDNILAAYEECQAAWSDLPRSIVKKERDRSLRRRAKGVLDVC